MWSPHLIIIVIVIIIIVVLRIVISALDVRRTTFLVILLLLIHVLLLLLLHRLCGFDRRSHACHPELLTQRKGGCSKAHGGREEKCLRARNNNTPQPCACDRL